MKITTLTMLMLCCAIYTCAQQPHRFDVLINEIMADPSPSPGLPAVKYIELYNISGNSYNLKGWTIGDGTATAKITMDFALEPDSFVVIGSGSAAAALAVFGKTIAVTGFPALRVTGDIISLRSSEGLLIHAVQYNKSTYANEVKAAGGWSLEMIDAKNPCGGNSNWRASTDNKGGTPGQPNAVAGNNEDETPPFLLHAYSTDSIHITLVFDEPLDSLSAAMKDNYLVSNGIGIPLDIAPGAPFFNKVTITLSQKLIKAKTYTVTVKNVNDCSGNGIATGSVKTGLASLADKNDIVINEVLFNAPDDGAEYVELYNRSLYPVDCKELYITMRNASGDLGTLKQLSTEHLFFFPGEYKVLTSDIAAVKKTYITKDPETFTEVSSMPSLPNSNGTIVLLNFHGDVVDELHYDEAWHFPLINNSKGVASERIDFSKPTQDKNNWHSAAASVGYGTPTYQNSQFRTNDQLSGEINLTPEVLSPDSDGYDDFVSINYRFPEPGYVCNITVFDGAGRPVRYLVRNALCGRDGYFRWDGLDEKNQKLRIGIYVVLTEVYNLQGKTKKFKQIVTLARKMY